MFVIHHHGDKFLLFHATTVHTIFTVAKLNNFAECIPSRSIIFNRNIFQCFDQTALNIPSLRCFTGSINQTFPSTHGMKEEFLGGQSSQVRIFHKPSTFRRMIIFCEVRQSSVIKPERNALSFNILLSHTSSHLGNIQE